MPRPPLDPETGFFRRELLETGVLRMNSSMPGSEHFYVLVRPVNTIGRHPSNSICLPRKSVSRHHARIERRPDGYFIEDLGSSNGTFVNGQQIRQIEIKNRDEIRFGDIPFTFYVNEEITPPPRNRADTTQVRFEKGGAESEQELLHTQSVPEAEDALKQLAEIQSIDVALKCLRVHYRFLDIVRQRPSEKEIMDKFLELIFDVVAADRGAILLYDETMEVLRPSSAHFRAQSSHGEEVVVSKTITDRCIRERIAILSGDVTQDARFAEAQSILSRPVRSTICVPLIINQRILGVCYLDTLKGIQAFDETDLGFVTNLASQLALALDNIHMSRERMQAEHLALIGQTMTEVAHSIKNILLVTRGGVEMMDSGIEQGDLNAIAQTWDLVRRGMNRMNRMATDMLSYVRMQERKREKTVINDVLREVYDEVKPQMDAQGIRLTLKPDPANGVCWIDPIGLYDTVTNLLVNAREAIDPEAEDGMIEIRAETIGDSSVSISIADNGIGMTPEQTTRIFQPFFTTKSHGTGMGMAMTGRFVAEMGGSIDIDSEPGAGTTIQLMFPLREEPEDDEANGEKDALASLE